MHFLHPLAWVTKSCTIPADKFSNNQIDNNSNIVYYFFIEEMGFHRVGIIPDRTCSFLFLFLKHHTNTFFLKKHV